MPPKLANGMWDCVNVVGPIVECALCYVLLGEQFNAATLAYRRRPREDVDDDDAPLVPQEAAPTRIAAPQFDKANIQRVMGHLASKHGIVGVAVEGLSLNDLKNDAAFKAWIESKPGLARRGLLRENAVPNGQPACNRWLMKPKPNVNILVFLLN